MLTRRSGIVLLAGLNLFLLGLLIAGTYSPNAAFAQAGGRSGGFLTVTAKAAGQSYDVLYVLDVPGKKMHAFYPKRGQGRKYAYGKFRDLKADFER